MAAWRSPAGSVSKPVCPETAGGTPQDSTSMTRATKPDQKSWDFDESKQDFGEKKNRRSPMLAHETSPVSGASVVGMTYGAHHGPGNMPASVPGVPTAPI
jgi:hypothetical protein